MPPLNVVKLTTRAGFLNILIKVFYPGSIERPTSALDNIDFNTLIFGIINWLEL